MLVKVCDGECWVNINHRIPVNIVDSSKIIMVVAKYNSKTSWERVFAESNWTFKICRCSKWFFYTFNLSATNGWLCLCKGIELSKLLSNILELPATNAACERRFSALGGLQSLKRNRFSQNNAMKLLCLVLV